MLRLAYLLTWDVGLAEEIAQEAFVKTWRAWDTIRRHESAAAFLRTTVLNLAKSALRRRVLELRFRTVSHSPAARDDLNRKEESLDLNDAVARLTPKRRACVVLRYYLDLSERETADLLGVSTGTVKSQTHKALQQMREHLAKDRPTSIGRTK